MSEYVTQWQDYRRRRDLQLFALIGFVPAVFVVALVSLLLFDSDKPAVAFLFCWMAFFVVASQRFSRFRCPRCGDRFFLHSGSSSYSMFAKKCVHCGLPKYAGEEPPS